MPFFSRFTPLPNMSKVRLPCSHLPLATCAVLAPLAPRSHRRRGAVAIRQPQQLVQHGAEAPRLLALPEERQQQKVLALGQSYQRIELANARLRISNFGAYLSLLAGRGAGAWPLRQARALGATGSCAGSPRPASIASGRQGLACHGVSCFSQVAKETTWVSGPARYALQLTESSTSTV